MSRVREEKALQSSGKSEREQGAGEPSRHWTVTQRQDVQVTSSAICPCLHHPPTQFFLCSHALTPLPPHSHFVFLMQPASVFVPQLT